MFHELVSSNPKKNLEACLAMLQQIRTYKAKKLAIGFSFPAGQPDAITVFFAQRGLRAAAYLRGDFSTGEATAYDENLRRLTEYTKAARAREITLCYGTIARLRDHQAHSFAVGLSWPSKQPDSFTLFFAERGLPIAYHAAIEGAAPIGDPSAYDKNVATLEEYLGTLPDLPAEE